MSITGTLTTDKTAYNSGDLITVTIKRAAVSAPTTQMDTVSGTLMDAAGESIVLTGVPVQVTSPGTAVASTINSVTDSAGRTFTKVSDDGATWVGTAKA